MKVTISLSLAAVLLFIAGGIVSITQNRNDASQTSKTKEGDNYKSRVRPKKSDVSNGHSGRKPSKRRYLSLTSPAEKHGDIIKRIGTLRHDIENSQDSAKLVADFLMDLSTLDDHTSRDHYTLRFVNQLVRIDRDQAEKYKWLSTFYPKIEMSLDFDLGQTRTLKNRLFGVLYVSSYIAGIDPYEEALKIQDPNTRENFIIELLPYMVTLNAYEYPDIMKTLSEQKQREVEQAIFSEAIANKAYRVQALDLYLEDRGLKGNHNEQLNKLFNDSAWFWKNSDKIGEAIANSNSGARRDIAIENMIKIIQRRDTESARKWLDEIDDQARVQNINSKLFNQ